MSWGFKTYDENGAEQFSSVDSTWTVVYTTLVPANTHQTFTDVPIMPTRVVVRQMLNQITGDDEAYVHTYTLSGSTLTVTAPDTANTVATFFVVYGK